jgi:phosphoglycolate phosphatase-like HAD superfamily hydrolase
MRNGNGRPLAVLFDIDGTLITTGGAGAVAWSLAFEELYGIPADIGQFSDAGMTDPEVAHLTFANVIGHEPDARELARLMAVRLEFLPDAVAESDGYRVLAGVEAAARFKLARGRLNRYFPFGGYGSDSTDRTELTKRAIERAAVLYGRAVSASRCVVDGDTPLDIAAAHGAGAIALGVASGHFSVADLQDAGADYVLSSLEEDLPL